MPDIKNPIVTYQELSVDLDLAVKRDKLNELLNYPPREEWIKKHPIYKVKDATGKLVALKYVPIWRQKLLLRIIFGGYRQEIIEVKQIANAVNAIVRVHFKDLLTGEMTWQDGSGAVSLQMDAGSEATDLASIKSNAVMLASPAAVSYAFKSACENIGKIFGGEVNNFNSADFVPMFSIEVPPSSTNNSQEINTKF